MSDTPRTDAAAVKRADNIRADSPIPLPVTISYDEGEYVAADFARDLERALAAAERERDEWKWLSESLSAGASEKERYVGTLKQQRDAAESASAALKAGFAFAVAALVRFDFFEGADKERVIAGLKAAQFPSMKVEQAFEGALRALAGKEAT
jgi:hypothetical protein